MKRAIILSSLVLAFAASADAQSGVNHRNTTPAGHSGHGNGQRASVGSRGYYPGGSYYPNTYIGGSPMYSPVPTQAQYVPGVVTFTREPAPLLGYNLYVPSYQRPDDGGPTLAERAASLKSARKPAVLNWTNWPDTAATERKN